MQNLYTCPLVISSGRHPRTLLVYTLCFLCCNMVSCSTVDPKVMIAEASRILMPSSKKERSFPLPTHPTRFRCFPEFRLSLGSFPPGMLLINVSRADFNHFLRARGNDWQRQVAKRGKCKRAGKLDWPTFRRNSLQRHCNDGVNELTVGGASDDIRQRNKTEPVIQAVAQVRLQMFYFCFWDKHFQNMIIFVFILSSLLLLFLLLFHCRLDQIAFHCFMSLAIQSSPVITNIQKHNCLFFLLS